MAKKVHLLDYVAGNIRSLVNAIEVSGYEVEWIKKPEDIVEAEKLILPGVGHFGHCLSSLASAGYLPYLQAHIAAGKPFFGICVGLQALFSGSDEAPSIPGLGLIEAQLRRFNPSAVVRPEDETLIEALPLHRRRKPVPCIGWNSALPAPAHSADFHDADDQAPGTAFYGLDANASYYFVHSYFAPYPLPQPAAAAVEPWTVTTTTYGTETYVSALGRGDVFATQFHPEKSGAAGLRVLKAFLDGRKWESLSPETTPHNPEQRSPPLRTNHGLTHRIIACLDVRANDAGDLVVTKGDQYDVRERDPSDPSNQVRNLGKPIALATKYYGQTADEITFLNITSFRSLPLQDLPMLAILEATARSVFVPLTIGGGIRDTVDPGTGERVSALEVARLYFGRGADKVSIGSEAVVAAEAYWARGGKGLGDSAIETISAEYGSQAVVVSVDPKRVYLPPLAEESQPTTTATTNSNPAAESNLPLPGAEDIIITTDPHPTTASNRVWYQCTMRGGREPRPLSVRALVRAVVALGAGEILLNAIDRDGTGRGFDLELIRHVKENTGVPVIASSGASGPGSFVEVFGGGRDGDGEGGGAVVADAALGAGIFHRGEWTVGGIKEGVEEAGFKVRRG